MKRILLCDRRPALLETVELLLRHWGYRVLVVHRPEQVAELVDELSFDLALVADDLLTDLAREIEQLHEKQTPIVTLGEPDPTRSAESHLAIPLDVFSIFALIQKRLERIPRRHLRLPVKVPALIERGGKEQLCEIISLSRQGLFVKSPLLMQQGERLCMILPLIGFKRELELNGRVLYVIRPAQENNYLNGFGLEFVDPADEALQALERFIERRLLAELATYGHTLLANPPHPASSDTEPLLKLLSVVN